MGQWDRWDSSARGVGELKRHLVNPVVIPRHCGGGELVSPENAPDLGGSRASEYENGMSTSEWRRALYLHFLNRCPTRTRRRRLGDED